MQAHCNQRDEFLFLHEVQEVPAVVFMPSIPSLVNEIIKL